MKPNIINAFVGLRCRLTQPTLILITVISYLIICGT
ncbi:hypothetical protein Aazo_2006 ['Nostoc azollae' 0708]|uniref:Uncharacterized protein n=1 Tax=Nostoc azollae (strain 0708) TaxID=551115 RepID=D7DWF6_NOSA0|nr:hypothetical protein Aazo_2006 ['Nostoc azollae' 0708]